MLESINARTAPACVQRSSPPESKHLRRGHLSPPPIASRISYRVLTVTDIGVVCPVTVPSVGPRTRVSCVVDANVNKKHEGSGAGWGSGSLPARGIGSMSTPAYF